MWYNNYEVIQLSIRYKFNVMEAIKKSGYTTEDIRTEFKIGESAMSNLRNERYVSLTVLNKVCKILRCQPGDIIEYVEDTR